MGHSLQPSFLTIGLLNSDKAQINLSSAGQFSVIHVDQIEQVQNVNFKPDSWIVSEEILKAHGSQIKAHIERSSLIVVTSLDIPVFAFQLKTPIQSVEFLRVVNQATGGVRNPKINWVPFEKGTVVTSRVTPLWYEGVVVECIESDYCLVLFPKAKPPFNAKPMRCHVSALKAIKDYTVTEFELKKSQIKRKNP